MRKNYPLIYEGDLRERYLNHKKGGGAIWNIFYLHCLNPAKWPIFDQHTFRAMHFLQSGKICEIGSTNRIKYEQYQNEFLPFIEGFAQFNRRKTDQAFFALGQFLRKATGYV